MKVEGKSFGKSDVKRLIRIKTGVKPLDLLIPKGVPINSFIVISGEGGTGKSVMLQELAIKFLRRGYVVIYVSVDDNPKSVIMNMKSLGWRVEKYLTEGGFKFVDCFSYRIRRLISIPPYVTLVEDPKSIRNVSDILVSLTERLNRKGVMIIDSLTEIISSVEPITAIETVKNWRAYFSKAKEIPVFASVHFGIKAFEEIEQIIDYTVDGIIDLRFDPHIMQQGMLVKQVRVRKLKGAPHIAKWTYFDIRRHGLEVLSKESVMKMLVE